MYLEFPRPRANGELTTDSRRRVVRVAAAPVGLILLAVLGLAAFVAIRQSRVLSGHPGRGWVQQSAAISTLRNVAAAQAAFAGTAAVDVDGDGLGEFGTFGELSGEMALRGSGAKLSPPVLSGSFRTVHLGGVVARSGYHFRIYLPSSGGAAGPQTAGGKLIGPAADADASESRWCAYAWPSSYASGGQEAFFVCENGVILQTDCPRYSSWNGPMPGAAFRGGAIDDLTGTPAINSTGNDGSRWKPIEE